MGMYDTLIDMNLRCPYCDSLMSLNGEIQTKDLDCSLDTFYIHHQPPKEGRCLICLQEKWARGNKKKGLEELFFGKAKHTHAKDIRSLRALGSCRSPACKYIEKMRQITELGYTSGFGRIFHLLYKVDRNGRAYGYPDVETGKGEPVDVENLVHLFNLWIDGHEAARKRFRILQVRFKDFGIAVLMFNWS